MSIIPKLVLAALLASATVGAHAQGVTYTIDPTQTQVDSWVCDGAGGWERDGDGLRLYSAAD